MHACRQGDREGCRCMRKRVCFARCKCEVRLQIGMLPNFQSSGTRHFMLGAVPDRQPPVKRYLSRDSIQRPGVKHLP